MTRRAFFCFRTVAAVWFVLCGRPDAVAVADNEQKLHDPRIAVLLDLQGSQASLGRPAMNGFVLALQQSHALTSPFAALVNTRSDPETARSTAEQIVSHVSLAAGFTDNDAVLLAGPVFQQQRIPFLSIGATDPALPDQVGEHIFLTPFGDNTQAAAAAEFGRREFGATVVILWDSTSEYTRSLPRYFRKRFEQLGGKILKQEHFAGGCDISALGRNLASSRPHFVYLAGLPDCIGKTIGSLRAAGINQPIIGGDGLDTPELLKGGPNPTSEVWYTTHAWLSEQTGTPSTRAFIAAYRDAYGAPPPDAFAALGYDAARLILDVLHRARGQNNIYDTLENTHAFKGITGTISYSPQSHVPLKTVWIVAVRKGEKKLATSFVPASVPPPDAGGR